MAVSHLQLTALFCAESTVDVFHINSFKVSAFPLLSAAEADGYLCVSRCRQSSSGSVQAPACLCSLTPGWKACGCAPKFQTKRLPYR